MSRFGRIRRRPDHWVSSHERARVRSAERLDGPLGLAEATWLDEHLAACPACAAIAAAYEADRHSLRDLCRDLAGVEISKEQQSSDWGADHLTEQQMAYAASDVLHLHVIRQKLDEMLAREGRTELAQACFDFLPTRAALDLAGWSDVDIFHH